MDRPAYPPAVHPGAKPHRRTPAGRGLGTGSYTIIMTSKDTDDGVPTPEAAAAYADRAALHQRIREGHLPEVDQLLAGSPFFSGDMKKDLQVWCDSWLLGTAINDWQKALSKVEDGILLRPVIQNLRDTGSDDALKTVEHVLRIVDHDDADRCLIYLACRGHDASRHQLISNARRGSSWDSCYDKLFLAATAIGMLYGRRKSMDSFCDAGLKIIETDADALERFNAAMAAAEKAKDSLGAVTVGKSVYVTATRLKSFYATNELIRRAIISIIATASKRKLNSFRFNIDACLVVTSSPDRRALCHDCCLGTLSGVGGVAVVPLPQLSRRCWPSVASARCSVAVTRHRLPVLLRSPQYRRSASSASVSRCAAAAA